MRSMVEGLARREDVESRSRLRSRRRTKYAGA